MVGKICEKVGLEPGVKERELWRVRVVSWESKKKVNVATQIMSDKQNEQYYKFTLLCFSFCPYVYKSRGLKQEATSAQQHDMGDRLATIIDMGRKLGLCPFLGWARSPSNTMWPGRGLPPCQVSSWSIQLFGHNTPTSQTDRQDRTYGTDGPIA